MSFVVLFYTRHSVILWWKTEKEFASHEPGEHGSTQWWEAADPPEYKAVIYPDGWVPVVCHNRWEARMRLHGVNRQEWLHLLVILHKKEAQICPQLNASLSTLCLVEKLSLSHSYPSHSIQDCTESRSSNHFIKLTIKWINQAVKALAGSSLLGSTE